VLENHAVLIAARRGFETRRPGGRAHAADETSSASPRLRLDRNLAGPNFTLAKHRPPSQSNEIFCALITLDHRARS
jgi:hypothetical protein